MHATFHRRFFLLLTLVAGCSGGAESPRELHTLCGLYHNDWEWSVLRTGPIERPEDAANKWLYTHFKPARMPPALRDGDFFLRARGFIVPHVDGEGTVRPDVLEFHVTDVLEYERLVDRSGAIRSGEDANARLEELHSAEARAWSRCLINFRPQTEQQ